MKFVKNTYGRTTHKGLQMVGRREPGTIDIGFNQELEKFNAHHKILKGFLNDIREYIKAFRTISITHASLNKAMEAFYEQNSPMYPVWQRSQNCGLALDQYRQKMDENIDLEVVAPINARLATYKILKKRIAERERRLVDYDRTKAELKNLSQNPTTKPEKLQDVQRRTAIAKHAYEILEDELMNDMQAIHQDRLAFFDPIMAVIFRMQAGYYTESAKLTSDLVGAVRHIESRAPQEAPITPADRTVANPKNIPPFNPESYTSPPASSSGLAPPSGNPYPGQPSSPREYQQHSQPPSHGGYQQPPQHNPAQSVSPRGFQQQQPYQQPGYGAPVDHSQYHQPPQQQQHYAQPPQQQQHRAVPPMPQRPGQPVPTSRPAARGVYAFQAGGPSELSFNVGDTLTILTQEGEWWMAELHGRQGLIPFNYVQLL
eukprot:TRINITY_DN2595_c0_g1_i1.p1 TRINITY_DN2595_c0_g1~~TRINITY_DN2595_c0_g1_i1.p1  ORF type:complete len:429 (-),score=97.22 TRINITY_DN2595_c0_g1_i1:230-1516(-)